MAVPPVECVTQEGLEATHGRGARCADDVTPLGARFMGCVAGAVRRLGRGQGQRGGGGDQRPRGEQLLFFQNIRGDR